MKNVLDVDGRDVIGKQDNFVGMKLVQIFPLKVLCFDQTALQQARNEGSRPGEGIKDMNVFIRQSPAEFLLQNIGNRMDDKIDDFNRGVNDAELLNDLGEGRFKKFIIQLDNDLLFPLRVVNPLNTLGDGFIEPRHYVGFPFRYFFMKHIDHALHGNGHRVILDEGVIFKERLEYRLCDDVLRQHFNGVIRSHSRIQIFVQPGKEFVKGIPVFPAVGDQLFNSGNVLLSDCSDILRPQLPITPGSHFFNHAGKDHALERLEFQV